MTCLDYASGSSKPSHPIYFFFASMTDKIRQKCDEQVAKFDSLTGIDKHIFSLYIVNDVKPDEYNSTAKMVSLLESPIRQKIRSNEILLTALNRRHWLKKKTLIRKFVNSKIAVKDLLSRCVEPATNTVNESIDKIEMRRVRKH